MCTPSDPIIKFLTGYSKLKVYISLDDSVARGVTLRARSWILRWHLHLHITSYDEEKNFTVWLLRGSASIAWRLTTSTMAQCGSQGSLKDWTQIIKSCLLKLNLRPNFSPYLKFFVSFFVFQWFFSVLPLLLTLLLAFFLQCFSPSFNYLFVICFLFAIILLFVTLLHFISYYFAIFPSFPYVLPSYFIY